MAQFVHHFINIMQYFSHGKISDIRIGHPIRLICVLCKCPIYIYCSISIDFCIQHERKYEYKKNHTVNVAIIVIQIIMIIAIPIVYTFFLQPTLQIYISIIINVMFIDRCNIQLFITCFSFS